MIFAGNEKESSEPGQGGALGSIREFDMGR
jgi:hypothetical protein